MEKKDYKNLLIILSCCIFIVLVVTRFTNVWGADMDWSNQHIIFPEYLRNMFYETGKLIPNFALNYGGGQNLYNISYYGLLSPVILPSYLMPHVSMSTYMMVANIIVVFISIILFYKWLKNNKYDTKTVFVTTFLFAFSEALLFHTHRHIMFVNYMPFLIMSLMGVDKLLEKDKKSFFVLSVFLMIMTSYYYSVCGILVIGCYFIYKYVKSNDKFIIKDFLKKLIKILLLGSLAVLMSSIFLLPTIYTLFAGRGEAKEAISLISLFIPYYKVHKVICGSYAIGYQLIGFAALLYLFFTKKKENIVLGVIVSIILFLPIFQYILNGGLYIREKCFIPFLPLLGMIIAYFLKDLFNNKIDLKKFSIVLLITTIILMLLNKFYVEYIYMFILIGLLMYYKKYKNIKVFSIILVSIAFIFCIGYNLGEDTVTIEDFNNYFGNQNKEVIDNIIGNDNTFYRIANLKYAMKNVNKIYNMKEYTTSFYSSAYNNDYLDFARKVFNNNNPDYNYFLLTSSSNPLFNTFMGVKYVYSDYDLGLGFEKINDNVYINNDAYPIMYHNTKYISEENFNNLTYPYTIQELLNRTVVKDNDTYTTNNTIEKVDLNYELVDFNKDNIEITHEEDKLILTVKDNDTFKIKLNEPLQNKILFITLYDLNRNGCGNGNTYININHIENLLTCHSWIYHNQNETFHYVISNEETNELTVEIGKGTYNISKIETYILDYNDIKDLKNNLTPFNIEEITDDTIKGNITVNEDGYFVTTIPYDEAFTIKVNDKEIEYEKVNTAFIGFKLNEGTYKIEFHYETPWLKKGILVTLISSLIFIVLIIFDVKQKKLNN